MDGQTLIYIILGVAAFVAVALIVLIIVLITRKPKTQKAEVNVTVTSQPQQQAVPQQAVPQQAVPQQQMQQYQQMPHQQVPQQQMPQYQQMPQQASQQQIPAWAQTAPAPGPAPAPAPQYNQTLSVGQFEVGQQPHVQPGQDAMQTSLNANARRTLNPWSAGEFMGGNQESDIPKTQSMQAMPNPFDVDDSDSDRTVSLFDHLSTITLECIDTQYLVFSCGFSHSIVVGRGTDADLRITGDNSVGRKCLEIYKQNGQYFIKDLNATNKARYNNETVLGTMPITSGGTLQLGVHSYKIVIKE